MKPLKVKTLHKMYTFEKLPSLDGFTVYSNELPDIEKALNNYAKAYAKVAISEIAAFWNTNGLQIEIADDLSSSIDISYKDFLNALVESTHEYVEYDYDADQYSLNCRIAELEDALKRLKSLKKENEV